MFGKSGKQYAGFVAQHVEGMLGEHLSKKSGKSKIGKTRYHSRLD